MTNRRQRIEEMLVDDPGDEFLRYSLAVELIKEDEDEPALELLRALAAGESPYVPAFFLAGRRLAEIDRVAEARTMLRQGVEQARRSGDAHAAGEMAEFLADLGAAGE